MKTTVYIYGLCDPRTGETFYVGKAKDPVQRLKAHSKDSCNPAKSRRIREIVISGNEVVIRILETVESNAWETAEAQWICRLLTDGQPLTNLTPGGNVQYAITPKDAYALMEILPERSLELERIILRELQVPLKSSRLEVFREASYRAILTLTNHLKSNSDFFVRLKTAMTVDRTIQHLEKRWLRLQS